MTLSGCGPEAAGLINGTSSTFLKEFLVDGTVYVIKNNSNCHEGNIDKV